MDEQLRRMTWDLMGLTYTRIVERYADHAFKTDRGTEFLTAVHQVCADIDLELLSDTLVDRLERGLDDPYDKFLLRTKLFASAAWEVGGWPQFLGALRRTFEPGGPTSATDRSTALGRRRRYQVLLQRRRRGRMRTVRPHSLDRRPARGGGRE